MYSLGRRELLCGVGATAALLALGCSKTSDRVPTGGDRAANSGADTPGPKPVAMTVYRDPSCGCCEQWARIAQQSGFATIVIDHADMPGIKGRYGVPAELASCHTAIVADYAIEGHVPMDAVRRLLKERPALKGIAVPGMPRGAPGMEMPDGSKDPFQVIGFDARGATSRWA